MTNKKTIIAIALFSIITLIAIILIVIVGTLADKNNYSDRNDSGFNNNGYGNYQKNQKSSYTEQNLPKFIKENYIDLNLIGFVSQFRSDNGHDFSDETAKCSSMKHYFEFPLGKRLDVNGPNGIPADPTAQNGVPIYAPVDGTILDIQSEVFPLGKQLHIQVKDYTDFKVRLFHIYPLITLKVGQQVKAGDQIGLINMGQGTDIAVEANINSNRRFYSIFELMTDQLFQKYIQKGASSRDEFILSEQYRKENPLTCNGQQFTNHSETWKEWVAF